MKFSKFRNKDIYKESLQFAAIGNRGVQMALSESKRKGLPVVFGILDKIFYRLPDGTITTKSPFKKK